MNQVYPPDATAYFVRETRKATWFTQVPVVLSKANGNPAFGQEWSATISRAGDYLLQTWLRLTLPAITLLSTNASNAALTTISTIRWTKNLMHNIVREASITFNDLAAARFDNFHLDFWAAFTTPAGKQNGYYNMIGNTSDLIQPVLPGGTLPPNTLNLPLPFFYGRDSGVALPTAALPYNEMRINFSFRDVSELLVYQLADNGATNPTTLANAGGNILSWISVNPVLGSCNVWANYAIVSNDERKRMACAPRDILIEQVQTAPRQSFLPNSINGYNPNYDIRFSHAIKVLFFAVRNNTCLSNWSNYSTASPIVTIVGAGAAVAANLTSTSYAFDPLSTTSLVYENTARLSAMGSDYYSLVNPWFNAPVIPNVVGYHSYSYSLDFICLDPMGSTNYGKLTNVSIIPTGSAAAYYSTLAVNVDPQLPSLPLDHGYAQNQSYEFIITAVNNNIIRISGGALGKNGKPKTGRCLKSCGNTFKDKHCNYHILTVC